MGRKSDRKQADPAPLAGSSKPSKEGTAPPKKRRSGGKNKPLIKDVVKAKSDKDNRKKEKKNKSAAVPAVDSEGHIPGLEEENEELAASRAYAHAALCLVYGSCCVCAYRAYFDAADLEEETAEGAEGFGDLDEMMAADGLEAEDDDEQEQDEFLVEDGLDGLEGLEEAESAEEIPQCVASTMKKYLS